LFAVDLGMTKAQRLEYHQAEVSHAMTLTGVDLDDQDQPTKWKVENSWGDKNGEKGYFTMSPDWMDDYVYEVVVRKKYLTTKQQALLKQAPIELPAWDSLA
jgi:aminopeptidase C